MKAALSSDPELLKSIKAAYIGVWEKHLTHAMKMLGGNGVRGAQIRLLTPALKVSKEFDYGFGTNMETEEAQRQYCAKRAGQIADLIRKEKPKRWY